MTEKSLTILVAIDFSDSSDRALDQALDLAVRTSARLILVHVCDLPEVAVSEQLRPATDDPAYVNGVVRELSERKQLLEALHDRVASEWGWCDIHLRMGDPVVTLLALIDELEPSLLVVGSHGRSGPRGTLPGHVSAGLCQRSPVPVLVVPAGGRPGAARAVVGGEHSQDREMPEENVSRAQGSLS